MAVFRVERNTGYTVMSNHHLRNKELSLKAKGLLSQMLSLPEDWDYRRNTALSVCGADCNAWFFDEDPADNAVQFVQLLTADTPLEPGTATARLTDLKQGIGEDAALLAEGNWELRFDFAFEDSSLELPGGQRFTVDGKTAVLNSVSISPLSLRIDYTVDTPVQPGDNTSGALDRYLHPQEMFLTLTDGSRIDLTGFGGGVQPEGDTARCEISSVFDRILPLDTIESITIGEAVIPVTTS